MRQSGEVVAGFRVERLIGSGGMGEVYLVQHPRLPRQDALKILRAERGYEEHQKHHPGQRHQRADEPRQKA